MSLLDERAGVDERSVLSSFRTGFFGCLTARADVLFELTDAVLCADGPVKTLGTLADLQREGKIRHLGLSKVSIETIESARGLAEITTIQNAFNHQDRSSEDVLDYCTAHGIGSIPYRLLGKGGLASPDPTAPCDGTKATGGQLALSWLLHRSPVILPIPGTSNTAHLRENIQAGHLDLLVALPSALASEV